MPSNAAPMAERLSVAPLWKAAFGDAPPLGHVLRDAFVENWTRFQALPGSKRYATNAQEKQTILDRANALIAACFDGAERGWVLLPRYQDTTTTPGATTDRLNATLAFECVDPTLEPEDQIAISVLAAKVDWHEKQLDWLFAEIAEDRETALLFDTDCQTVLAPYDGGFDVVSLNPEKVGKLEAKFSDWMSERTDKL